MVTVTGTRASAADYDTDLSAFSFRYTKKLEEIGA